MACCDWLRNPRLLRYDSALTLCFSPAAHLSTVMNIYQLYKRGRQLKEISSSPDLNRSLYIRLMILSSIQMIVMVPLGSYWISFAVKLGIRKWVSWADTHRDHNQIEQIPSILWKHNADLLVMLELSRWALVLGAFVSFAFFGLAGEARARYRRVYKRVVRHIGCLTLCATCFGLFHVYVVQRAAFGCKNSCLFSTSSSPHMKSEVSGDMVFAVKSGIESDTTIAPPNQLPIPNEFEDEYEIEQHSTSQPAASASVSTLVDGSHGPPHQPPMATSAPIPAFALPQPPDTANSAIQSTPPHPTDAADVV
jgi:hypothetical protein